MTGKVEEVEDPIYETWLEDYETVAREQVNGDPMLHRACALWLVSSVVSPQSLRLTWGHVRTNLWFMAFGESGKTHKSVTLNHARLMAFEVRPGRGLPSEFSPEGLVVEMSGHVPCECSLCIDEVGGLLSSMDKKYMADVTDILCRAYDGTDIDRKLASNRFRATTPYLSIISATTESRFLETVTVQHMESGFLARFIPLVFQPPAFRATTTWKNEDTNDWNRLVERLKVISEKRFDWSITPEALAEYNAISEKIDALPNNPLDTRLKVCILKIAMVRHLARDDSTGVIELEDVRYGYRFTQEAKASFATLYAGLKDSTDLRHLRTLIRIHSPIKFASALQHSGITKEKHHRNIETLKDTGEIVEGGGQWKEHWIWTGLKNSLDGSSPVPPKFPSNQGTWRGAYPGWLYTREDSDAKEVAELFILDFPPISLYGPVYPTRHPIWKDPKLCSEVGCEKVKYAKERCESHYRQSRRTGKIESFAPSLSVGDITVEKIPCENGGCEAIDTPENDAVLSGFTKAQRRSMLNAVWVKSFNPSTMDAHDIERGLSFEKKLDGLNVPPRIAKLVVAESQADGLLVKESSGLGLGFDCDKEDPALIRPGGFDFVKEKEKKEKHTTGQGYKPVKRR